MPILQEIPGMPLEVLQYTLDVELLEEIQMDVLRGPLPCLDRTVEEYTKGDGWSKS